MDDNIVIVVQIGRIYREYQYVAFVVVVDS
jgi:hypothetical protein